jgi:opacity protein-like surface antigen
MGRNGMKRIACGVVAFLLLLSANGSARAEEETTSVAEFAAGFKTWINNWKSEQPGSEIMRSSYNALIGWEAEAAFTNGVIAGVSYLMSVSDYTFDHNAATPDVRHEDFILAIGYRFYHRVDVFTGYRGSQFWQRETQTKTNIYGPLLGIGGAAPLNKSLSLFSKLTYFPLSNKKTTGETGEKETAKGWSAEAGVMHVFSKRISGALGYRYEAMKGKKTRVKDTFAGPTINVMYNF